MRTATLSNVTLRPRDVPASPDEKYVIERDPKFVEDLVRDVVNRLNHDPRIGHYVVEVENFQSPSFPAGSMPCADVDAIGVRLSELRLARPRQWGACWLALNLWQQLELDSFWRPRLRPSREGTPWLKVLKTLVTYRLIDPGSEWRLHRQWFDGGAMAALSTRTSRWPRRTPCTAVWIGWSNTRTNCSRSSGDAGAGCSAPSWTCCCTTPDQVRGRL